MIRYFSLLSILSFCIVYAQEFDTKKIAFDLVEGNAAGYFYKVEEKDGFIIVNTVYQIAESILPSTYYQPMKTFEKKQINVENQQVVLVKL